MDNNTQKSYPHYPNISTTTTTPTDANPFYQPQPPLQHPSISSDVLPGDTNPFYRESPPPSPIDQNHSQEQPHHYPSISSTSVKGKEQLNSSHQESPPPPPPPPPPVNNVEAQKLPQPQPHYGTSPSSSSPPLVTHLDDDVKWGTHVMGTPAVPTVHPNNKKAAMWGASTEQEAYNHHQPYVQYSPIEKSNSNSPMENILHTFNSWSSKAEIMATNIWQNLKTGSSVTEAAWGKVNLRAKALTGGGFEAFYKQTFTTYPNETLKKTFACYLSTSTGPVAGTLYLSNFHAAFCSDRPLSFTAPSGQVTWSYYKVMVPLGKIGTINPVVMRENSSERYIQIVTVDGHDFWFMGFVNFEKASRHLTDSICSFAATGVAVPLSPPPPHVAP